MVHIRIICVGNCRDQHFKAACAEYQKRLRFFCKLELLEVTESKRDGKTPAEISEILKSEGLGILNKLEKSDYVVALCVEVACLTSEELAVKLEDVALSGKSRIAFVIGGSFGLSQEVKRRADVCLSISRMTFPHQLARVLLLEQIYRSFAIQRGIRYHK